MAVSPRDIPFFGVLLDLVATGGDTVLAVLVVFIDSLDLWLPFLSRLAFLSDVFEWIPGGSIEQLLLWVTIVFVAVYAARIGRRIKTELS